ncbi:hypothetical protein L0337_16990 [candidate division KSB1 bacterium]|nr:hypothetical protein [candidate division KSB1 bacterium]
MKPALIFVYNAGSGLFNSLTDLVHKIFSPQTYHCNLCAITYSVAGMRKEWKDFLDSLDMPMEFLHRDEFEARHGLKGVPLPAIFKKVNDELEVWIDAEAINSCRTLDDLKQLITQKTTREKN